MEEIITGKQSRKACILELASRVPEESFDDLKGAFRMNDENGQGRLNRDDFARCLALA